MSEPIEVVFLGTGGGVPSARRFLPAMALRRGGEWFLFDAGEGVQMRIRQSPLGWAGLRAIFISHLHGDHVLGLPGLLMSIGMAKMEAPLEVFAPRGLQRLIDTVLQVCRVQLPFPVTVRCLENESATILRGSGYRIDAAPLRHRAPCWGFFFREDERPGRFFPEKAQALGVPAGPLYKELQSGRVVELPDGVVVRPADVMGPDRPGRVVAYCTDTLPCRETVQYSLGADLLIHDATFGEGLEDEARISGHSTAAQAAEIARAAGARRLALTHISARYDADAPLLESARQVFPNSVMAADLLRLSVDAQEA